MMYEPSSQVEVSKPAVVVVDTQPVVVSVAGVSCCQGQQRLKLQAISSLKLSQAHWYGAGLDFDDS